MNSRRLLFIVMVTGFCAVARGNQLNTIAAIILSDTNVLAQIAPESSLIIKSEKKNGSENGFKDLFIASSMGGSNRAKLNPRAVSFVRDYVDRNGKELQNMKGWGRPYFSLIDNILTSYGLPRELKYLAVIESQLKPNSVSWAGAVGPWQLMPSTARVLGLKVSRRYDERTNYYKSTRAAAKYLRDLYNELGDWLLVIAAYNGGTAHVYNAMRRSGSHDFWNLQYYLPAESRNHVKKFIGTHYVFEGQGGITTLTKDEATEQLSGSSMYVFNRKLSETELINSKTNSISGKYHSSIIAKYILMDPDEFNRYNPDFDKVMASANNTYDLTLPAEKMDLFVANKYQILNESVQLLLNGVSEADSANQKISNNAIAKRDKK
ncbi:MAG TPA: lytic transglycosylase domain-containing protein [Puia sp.]|nr:lytic transglycosylase domain-containing protein [Puia sp.]